MAAAPGNAADRRTMERNRSIGWRDEVPGEWARGSSTHCAELDAAPNWLPIVLGCMRTRHLPLSLMHKIISQP
jgi:hypothetical protein